MIFYLWWYPRNSTQRGTMPFSIMSLMGGFLSRLSIFLQAWVDWSMAMSSPDLIPAMISSMLMLTTGDFWSLGGLSGSSSILMFRFLSNWLSLWALRSSTDTSVLLLRASWIDENKRYKNLYRKTYKMKFLSINLYTYIKFALELELWNSGVVWSWHFYC